MAFEKGIDEVDLHGLRPEMALRRVAQAIHTARVRGRGRLRVITGRGLGNPEGKPVLRGIVEDWLQGPEGRRAGVRSVQQVARGGALEIELG
jgi:DNA-nicking Smr family endonuclease